MDPGALLFETIAFIMAEASLAAAAGFLVLGLSDLAIDLIWLALACTGRLAGPLRSYRSAVDLPPPLNPGMIAVFVPAWDEAAVIGPMLGNSVKAFGEADYRIYVGCYYNDPATIAAARAVSSPHVRIVVGGAPGPTSKADCLNRLWAEMLSDEAREGRRFKAVLLHDAEDIVHSAELRIFDTLIERFDLVQLPVLPLPDPGSRWIGGHYLDEFAEAHGKDLVVRAALGAGLPSAGVGCAISREALGALAEKRGAPFDPDSLTEDYELGLRLKQDGCRSAFVRLRAAPGRPLVATKEYFPSRLDGAVAQKTRWVTGIALAGWERLGWSGGLAERWMRLRDRQSVLAAFLLAAAYVAILGWGALALVGGLSGRAMTPFTDTFVLLATLTSALLVWRLIMRFAFVAHAYGWREGLRSPIRALIGNAIAMLAAWRALSRYASMRRTGKAEWGKTSHAFPVEIPAE